MSRKSGFRDRAPSGRGDKGGPPGRGPRRPAPERRRADPDIALIWGFHAVREALRAPRRKLVRLYATPAAQARLEPEIAGRGVETTIVDTAEIDARAPADAIHQGVLLEARPLAGVDLDDLANAKLILVLDQVTDPHNVGAILRTAAAFAVDAIVSTERHSPAHTGVLAKSASGALEHVPFCTVVNLARAMTELGEMGFTRIGLDSDAPESLAATALQQPLALVLGAEGKGLRRLTRDHCDAMARLDLPGAIRSLNVSNACAVALTIITSRLAKA